LGDQNQNYLKFQKLKNIIKKKSKPNPSNKVRLSWRTYVVKDISWRNEMVHGESRHVKHHIINGPNLFHPGSAMLH